MYSTVKIIIEVVQCVKRPYFNDKYEMSKLYSH